MSKAEINQMLSEAVLCRIAFRGKNSPYIAPFQYVSIGGTLYFHFTNYGRKIALLEEGKPVCVEIENFTPDFSEYYFVALVGKLKVVTDADEKGEAVNRMVEYAEAKNLSTNFLPAHGIPKEADWSSMKVEKPLIIVKLVEITETIGLRSP